MKNTSNRNFGCQPFISNLKKLTKSIFEKRGFSCMDIIEYWVDIVGMDLAQGVKPEKISYSQKNKGTLHVSCFAGAYATLLEQRKKIVLEKINTFFGKEVIRDIKIRQTPSLLIKENPQSEKKQLISKEIKQKVQEKIQIIPDKDLRQAAFQLGISIFQKKVD